MSVNIQRQLSLPKLVDAIDARFDDVIVRRAPVRRRQIASRLSDARRLTTIELRRQRRQKIRSDRLSPSTEYVDVVKLERVFAVFRRRCYHYSTRAAVRLHPRRPTHATDALDRSDISYGRQRMSTVIVGYCLHVSSVR